MVRSNFVSFKILDLLAGEQINLHDLLSGSQIVFPSYEPPERVSEMLYDECRYNNLMFFICTHPQSEVCTIGWTRSKQIIQDSFY